MNSGGFYYSIDAVLFSKFQEHRAKICAEFCGGPRKSAAALAEFPQSGGGGAWRESRKSAERLVGGRRRKSDRTSLAARGGIEMGVRTSEAIHPLCPQVERGSREGATFGRGLHTKRNGRNLAFSCRACPRLRLAVRARSRCRLHRRCGARP